MYRHSQNYIHKKIAGNGYDYPFIIYCDETPIGYIVCCDLYAYKGKCIALTGLFTDEEARTFCMDLFIGEEGYLDKGFGTQIVKAFQTIFLNISRQIKSILILPKVTNEQFVVMRKQVFSF